MPGKTAGHLKFLPLSAKLRGVPTVITATGEEIQHQCAYVALAQGLVSMNECDYSNSTLHLMCV